MESESTTNGKAMARIVDAIEARRDRERLRGSGMSGTSDGQHRPTPGPLANSGQRSTVVPGARVGNAQGGATSGGHVGNASATTSPIADRGNVFHPGRGSK